jgi:RNA polymerase sigma-70 factor (ECF subfamily)
MVLGTKQPDEPADFDEVYMRYYPALNRYAYLMVKDGDVAEDMVHNVFLKLVESEVALNNPAYQKAYLYRSVYNECLNHIKHQQIRKGYQNEKNSYPEEIADTDEASIQHKELKQTIAKALDLLPEQCRRVFQLSRYEELKYKEIADLLGISVNTVEKHMVKALKRLRVQLEDYLPLFVFLFLNN